MYNAVTSCLWKATCLEIISCYHNDIMKISAYFLLSFWAKKHTDYWYKISLLFIKIIFITLFIVSQTTISPYYLTLSYTYSNNDRQPTLQIPAMHMSRVPRLHGVPSSALSPSGTIIVSSLSVQYSSHGSAVDKNLVTNILISVLINTAHYADLVMELSGFVLRYSGSWNH